MKNFLITAANSDIAIGIARILREHFPQTQLIGIAPDGQLPGAYFFDKIYPISLVTEFDAYRAQLEAILAAHEIALLCPIAEKELSFYTTENYRPIPNTLMNSREVLTCFLDKYHTYQWLKAHDLPAPATALLSQAQAWLSCNCMIKPRSSAGSKNMYHITNRPLFEAVWRMLADRQEDFVIQQYMGTPEEEYTCALWRFKGEYREIILKRKLLGGLTREAVVSHPPAISSMLSRLADCIAGDFFINVQLRVEKGAPFIFEINPRFSSTVMLRHKVGFQDVLWSFRSVLKMDTLPYTQPKPGTHLFRMAEELVIY